MRFRCVEPCTALLRAGAAGAAILAMSGQPGARVDAADLDLSGRSAPRPRSRGDAGSDATARRAGRARVGAVVLHRARSAPRNDAARGSTPADPAAYPAPAWRLWDEIDTDAHNDGISVDFDLMGGAPRWAIGSGAAGGQPNPNWEPNARPFGAFVRADRNALQRQLRPDDGKSVPGDPDDLPRVDFWSVWNEPDYGPSLAPQGVPGHLRIENSPRLYRDLVDAAWSGLQATGHTTSTDTILFGELAPRGESYWGVFSGMTPLDFLRNLYCVDSNYHQLRGAAARCGAARPPPPARARFRAQNPALFEASGVSDHPYMRWYPPNHELNPDPVNHLSTRDYTSLGVIGNLTRAHRPPRRGVRVEGLASRSTTPSSATSPRRPSIAPTRTVQSTKVYYLSPAVAARLHQLGRVHQLAQPAAALVRPVPPVRHRASDAGQRLGRVRQRAADLDGHAEGDLLRVPPAPVPAGDDGAARPLARGVGVRPTGDVRRARHRRAADRPDRVRPGIEQPVHDDPDGHDRPRRELLLRRPRDIPIERQRTARIHISTGDALLANGAIVVGRTVHVTVH